MSTSFDQPTGGGQQMQDVKAKANEAVRQKADEAVRRAEGVLSKQKELACTEMGNVANVLRKSADDLKNQNHQTVAEVFNVAANGLDKVASRFQERDVDNLLLSVRDTAKQHPVMFLAGSIVAGLLLERFISAVVQRTGERVGDSDTSLGSDIGVSGDIGGGSTFGGMTGHTAGGPDLSTKL